MVIFPFINYNYIRLTYKSNIGLIFTTFKDIVKSGKKYNIIYADPPWSYNDKALAGNRGAGCKYDLMSLEELKNLPLENICNDDCILFMWATFPQLSEALQLIKSWGFKYKTVGFVWIKKNKDLSNFTGMGWYTRSNAEIVLIARKGKIKIKNHSVNQVIETIRESHSKKPGGVRDRIVKLCGDLPRIELFSRQEIYGWDSFGNQVQALV